MFEHVKHQGIQELGFFGTLPVYLAILLSLLFYRPVLSLILVIALVAMYALTSIIRFFFHRERPKKLHHNNILEKLDASSFPSLHSGRAMFLAIILGFEFNVLPLFIFFALLTGYSRIAQKKHHLSDVVGGYIMALVIVAISII